MAGLLFSIGTKDPLANEKAERLAARNKMIEDRWGKAVLTTHELAVERFKALRWNAKTFIRPTSCSPSMLAP